jgi:hypothetical protein
MKYDIKIFGAVSRIEIINFGFLRADKATCKNKK